MLFPISTGITLAAVGLILIPIISGVFSFLLSKVSMSQSAQTAAANGSTKMMMWMMPLMSIYIAFIVPAALGVYWAAQSAFSIIQEMVLGKFYTKKLQEEEDAHTISKSSKIQPPSFSHSSLSLYFLKN